MKFNETAIAEARIIELEPRTDERGFFSRLFCADEFLRAGLEPNFAQVNDSLSRHAGTLRGLHYQRAPAAEAKLVRCARGAAFDVIVDLRQSSPTFGRWFGAQIDEHNRLMMYVPKGCAHGYLTLEDDTELIYFSSHPYSPSHEGVVRWNDPAFRVEWPRAPVFISEKDATAADYDPQAMRS